MVALTVAFHVAECAALFRRLLRVSLTHPLRAEVVGSRKRLQQYLGTTRCATRVSDTHACQLGTHRHIAGSRKRLQQHLGTATSNTHVYDTHMTSQDLGYWKCSRLAKNHIRLPWPHMSLTRTSQLGTNRQAYTRFAILTFVFDLFIIALKNAVDILRGTAHRNTLFWADAITCVMAR